MTVPGHLLPAELREPYAYLRRVVIKLPRATTVEDIEALLPWNLTAQDLHVAQP
ncbi:MAG: transposase domain-containing protein [Chromatiales bacterium]|nr:transposase domain-containing protein [Chromatiales bacterium]